MRWRRIALYFVASKRLSSEETCLFFLNFFFFFLRGSVRWAGEEVDLFCKMHIHTHARARARGRTYTNTHPLFAMYFSFVLLNALLDNVKLTCVMFLSLFIRVEAYVRQAKNKRPNRQKRRSASANEVYSHYNTYSKRSPTKSKLRLERWLRPQNIQLCSKVNSRPNDNTDFSYANNILTIIHTDNDNRHKTNKSKLTAPYCHHHRILATSRPTLANVGSEPGVVVVPQYCHLPNTHKHTQKKKKKKKKMKETKKEKSALKTNKQNWESFGVNSFVFFYSGFFFLYSLELYSIFWLKA